MHLNKNHNPNNSSYQQYMQLIGEKLYMARHLRREKMTSVAKANNVSPAVISRIENGRYESLSIYLLIQLADYYNISPSDIITPGK